MAGEDSFLSSQGKGTIKPFGDVLFVPKFSHNLLSVSALRDSNFKVQYDSISDVWTIYHPNGSLLVHSVRYGKLCFLCSDISSKPQPTMLSRHQSNSDFDSNSDSDSSSDADSDFDPTSISYTNSDSYSALILTTTLTFIVTLSSTLLIAR